MSDDAYPVLLVSHRGFGEGLMAAAQAILGALPAVDLLDNHGISPEELERRIGEWLEGHPGPAVILTDLGFGSCCQAARRVTRGRNDVGVIAGVNLPVLLAAFRPRSEHRDLEALMQHLRQRGQESLETYLKGSPV